MAKILFIFVLPLVTLIASFLLRAASGPFWQYSDPCYLYLFNAFQIIQGHVPWDVSHPGTPLQVLIAVSIWTFNIGRNASDTVLQALIDPEFYLRVVYIFLVLSSFLTSVISGLYIWRKTNDKLAVLLVQCVNLSFLFLPSFNSGKFPVLPVVANVSPEPLMMAVMNLVNLFILGLYFSREPHKSRHIIYLAVACGLGFAVKMNFIFILLAAFLLVPLRKKVFFMFVCALSFVIFTLPILSSYPQVFGWMTKMAGYSSRYGTGSQEFIDVGTFLLYLKQMIMHYWFFIVAALSIFAWGLIRLIKDIQHRGARFLTVLSFCFLLHIAATAKYFSIHYLLPAFGLFGSIFVLFYLDLKIPSEIRKGLTVVFISIFTAVCAFYALTYYQKLEAFTQDIGHFNERISKKYPQCTVIPSTTGDMDFFLNEQEALQRANGTAFRLESESLFHLYPHSYYFFSEEVTSPDPNVESYGIWNYKYRVWGNDIVSSCPCAIFIKYTSDFSSYPYQVQLLERSKHLSAYLLTGSTEREANDYFAQTMDALKRGEYQRAMVLGLKSRQLNYQPQGQLDYILMMIYRKLQPA